jgi:hypothetical protein
MAGRDREAGLDLPEVQGARWDIEFPAIRELDIGGADVSADINPEDIIPFSEPRYPGFRRLTCGHVAGFPAGVRAGLGPRRARGCRGGGQWWTV